MRFLNLLTIYYEFDRLNKKGVSMNVIRRILEKVACCHEWESVMNCDKYEDSNSQKPYKTTILFCCHKCGKLKKVVIE